VRPSATQTQLRYAYDAVTGALSRIIDPIGYPYTFHYRTDGALDTLWLPGNAIETRAYDADGRLSVRTRAAEAISYRDSLWYDLRGKATEVHTRQGQYHISYDGRGQLVHSFTNEWTSFNVPESEEEYFRDALGDTRCRG